MGLGDLSPDSGDGESGGSRREYVQPTKEEFEECLFDTGYDWTIDMKAPGMEYVYDTHDFAQNHNGIVLRVYSTIDKRTSMARSKDSDAIRLVVWNRHVHRPMGGRKKTLRISTWCKNLKEKIHSMFAEVGEYIVVCDQCGKYMVIRDGRYGKFYGCTGYPDCDNTINIQE